MSTQFRSGKDALGEVNLKCDFEAVGSLPAKGASTDVIEASARAYLTQLIESSTKANTLPKKRSRFLEAARRGDRKRAGKQLSSTPSPALLTSVLRRPAWFLAWRHGAS